ncbi:hypothetical protein EHW66_20570 [Erwinia psidii]|uniref:hypothetical protein n=1 Tax=Erwinia psidii TaxID=69224 RepID=UPI00226B81EE|nr:hypothetical protein [Erwinia psidii]MCX8959086.1 hypothetical protein [Erwinia psidii]MCX8967276.1 hypothetical protein [Erwinia psidii]
MPGLKQKIATNGFSKRELLGFKRQFDDIKRTYHPNITNELTLESLIEEEASKSVVLTRLFILGIIVFTIVAWLFGRWSYLYMPAGLLFFALLDVRSSAKDSGRTICCQFKLMKLAIRKMF